MNSMWRLLLSWASILLAVESTVTQDGCACREEWTLTGYDSDPCTDHCCNPDSDPTGDWCFVEDETCQGSNWGYCAENAPEEPEEPAEPEGCARVTEKGCACVKTWSVDSYDACTDYCCNPYEESSGDWCFVSDPSCEGQAWGNCQATLATQYLRNDLVPTSGMQAPFRIVAGTGCCISEEDGNCLVEQPGEGGCIFEIAEGIGHVQVDNFVTGSMTLNGFVHNFSMAPGPYDFRAGFGLWEGSGCSGSSSYLYCSHYGSGKWSACARGSSSQGWQQQPAFQVPDSEQHPSYQVSPDGLCLSMRDTLDNNVRNPCIIQVAPGSGPIIWYKHTLGEGVRSQLYINGHDANKMVSLLGIRPVGSIEYIPGEITPGEYTWKWEICVQGRNGTASDAPDTGGESDTNTTQETVLEAANGAGGTFKFLPGTTNQDMARLACESEYGPEGCIHGQCGCFQYYYRSGSGHCDCSKAPNEYEWVYGNAGCLFASQDYFEGIASEYDKEHDWWTIQRYEKDILVPDTFVRYRTEFGCGKRSWSVAFLGIGKGRLPNHHLVLDLRASNYTPGSSSLANLAAAGSGQAAHVDGAFFDAEEQTFIFGSNYQSGLIEIPVMSFPAVTWSIWIQIPTRPIGQNIIMEGSSHFPGYELEPRLIDLMMVGHPPSTQGNLEIETNAPLNEWCHIAMVHHNDTHATYYVNGQAMRMTTGHVGILSTPGPEDQDIIRIGAGEQKFPPATAVWISDVAIFNRGLFDAEIKNLYNAGRPSGEKVDQSHQARKCRFNGDPEEFAVGISAVKPPKGNAPFQVVEGVDCEVQQEVPCITSVRRRRGHVREGCKFRMTRDEDIKIEEFDVGNNYRTGSQCYYGQCENGFFTSQYHLFGTDLQEEHIIVGDTIMWRSYENSIDVRYGWGSITRSPMRGWTICQKRNESEFKADLYLKCLQSLVEDAEPEEMKAVLGPNATSCPDVLRSSNCNGAVSANFTLNDLCAATCSGKVTLQQRLSEQALSTATTASWKLLSGSCSVQGSCVTSPFFPFSARNNDSCLLKPPPSAIHEVSPIVAGTLEVNGNVLSAKDHTLTGIVPTTLFSWASGDQPSPGWKICSGEKPSCGEKCATSAVVACGLQVQGCSDSVLQEASNISCPSWTNRPFAEATTCESTSSWIQLDLGRVLRVAHVRLRSCEGENHCGRMVELSEDGVAWWAVYKQSVGYGPTEPKEGTVMSFEAQSARYLRVYSGRSISQPLARFLQISVADPICEDDPGWVDHLYGNGEQTCLALLQYNTWCYQRGVYSLEALSACPQSCGMCQGGFQQLPVGTGCSTKLLLDESSKQGHTESAMACFRYCVLHDKCTHFESELGTYCRRFSGCLPQQATGTSRAFAIPAKTLPAGSRMINHTVVGQHYVLKDSGQCNTGIESRAECNRIGSDLGFRVDEKIGDSWTAIDDAVPGVCFYDAQRGILTFTSASMTCTPYERCLCSELTTQSWPNVSSRQVYTDALAFKTGDLPLEITPVSSICVASKQGQCRGQVRRLRRLEAPDLNLGPWTYFTPADWDADGDIDLLIGRVTGELVYVENVKGALDLATAVGLSRNTLANVPCVRTWESAKYGACDHWCCNKKGGDICFDEASSWGVCQSATAWNISVKETLIPVVVDFNGDSALDVIAASCNGDLQYWRRTGQGFLHIPHEPLLEAIPSDGACLYPAVVDWDGDGDLDVLVGRASGTIDYYENMAGSLKHLVGSDSPLHGVEVEGLAAPSAVDWDNDGDIDLLVGNSKGTVEYYARTEQGALIYEGPLPNVKVDSNSIPAGIDWDNDGDTDLVLMNHQTGMMDIIISEQVNTFAEKDSSGNPFAGLPIGPADFAHMVDWNGDGSLDLIVGTADGRVEYFEAGHDGALRPVESAFKNLTGLGSSLHLQCIDYDDDGDKDLLVGNHEGALMFFEHEAATGQFRKGQPLFDKDVALSASSTLHAVDWDKDGDLDLLIGESGGRERYGILPKGLPVDELNQWFHQQGPHLSIAGRSVFTSEHGGWVLAFCQSLTYWFIFRNDTATWNDNLDGKCSGMVARMQRLVFTREYPLDRFWLNYQSWGIVASAYPSASHSDLIPILQYVESDGSPLLPHCETCLSTREHPECGCSISTSMAETCAKELCQGVGFEGSVPMSMMPFPIAECTCLDQDDGAQDTLGRSCGQYLESWCGKYDHASFNSTEMCCTCRGGLHPTEDVQHWKIIAGCFRADTWLSPSQATIADVKPAANLSLGHVRYFERTGGKLVERHGVDNPFGHISVNSRPFPYVIDWNRDGLNDLVLGGQSEEVITLASSGPLRYLGSTGDTPGQFCSWLGNDRSTCIWNEETKRVCANSICRAKGYTSGKLLIGLKSSEAGKLSSNTFEESPCTQDYSSYYGIPSYYFDIATGRRHFGLPPAMSINGFFLCRSSGIRQYDQQKDGKIVENTEAPLTQIGNDGTTIAQIIDHDNDGLWDAIVSGNNVRYFKLGLPCQVDTPCSGQGLCDERTGKCACKPGHTFHDCSGCASQYSSQRLPNTVASCQSCPGLGGDGGVCEGRGSCVDNAVAQAELLANQTGSNSTIHLAVGSGDCVCSTHFGGLDSSGHVSCADGVCPAGSELKLQPGNLVSACSPCATGAAKEVPGNQACEPCIEGRFSSLNGAKECTACPAGKFQDRKGQDSCQVCLPTSFSVNESSSCSACPIGRFADQQEMSECRQCPPGRWSSAIGADQCAACAAGRYGSGFQECQPCEAGSYSEKTGLSTCILCEPGRYSAALEADSGSTCQDCDAGRFSSLLGASSLAACTACGDGAPTMRQGATDSSMCIQPASGNFTCISGRDCAITITGTGLLPASHKVAIVSAKAGQGSFNPTAVSMTSSDGAFYTWKSPIALNGGLHELLWCSGLQGPCDNMAAFGVQMGLIALIGPAASSFTCVRGQTCENLELHGLGLQGTDAIQLQRSCGLGPAVSLAGSGAHSASINHDAGSRTISFGFGSAAVSINPNKFQVCWCSGQPQGGSCTSEEDFLVPVGPLKIEGPRSGNEVTCSLGQACGLGRIDGVNIGDRLMVLERCGTADQLIEGMPGNGVAETANGVDFEFLPLTQSSDAKVLQSVPGLYRLCFCRPPAESSGGTCGESKDFLADAGLFQAKGPYSGQVFGCEVGSDCVLSRVQGIGLEDADELEIRNDADATCETNSSDLVGNEQHPGGFQSTRFIAQGEGQLFALGAIPSHAAPSKYLLCWRPHSQPSSHAFRATLGFLFVTCPAGTYRLKDQLRVTCADCPLGFFCVGGAVGSADFGKGKCADGSTTLSSGSSSVEHCLCNAGFFRDVRSKACVACPVGRYKSLIADNTSCPGVCPNGTSTQVGASIVDNCYAPVTDVANSSVSQAQVFVLQGGLQVPACVTDEKTLEMRQKLRLTLANFLNVRPSEVTLEFPEESPGCGLQSNDTFASRRLEEQILQAVTYKIHKANGNEADRLMQNAQEEATKAAIRADLAQAGISVIIDNPSISSELLDCSKVGQGRSFPFGARPTSVDECTCAPGYELQGATCMPCAVGLFKSSIGEQACSSCPRVTVVDMPAQFTRLTTISQTATGDILCICPDGFYNLPGHSLPPQGCQQCGSGHYCSSSKRTACPAGSTTLTDTAKSHEECVCNAGYSMSFPRNSTYRCDPCDAGKFKAVVGDTICSQDCPAFRDSYPGAKSSEDCFCVPGYFYQNVSDSCERCPPDGVICSGGFYPAESRTHAEPISQSGYYMTGFANAEECYTEDEEGESVCLEGATWSNRSAACAGMQTGDLCGACLHMSSRDLGDEPCEPCDEAITDWMHVASINADLVLKAVFGIFLGKQAMDSAHKTKKMEAVIIRIVLQWSTASSVLASFDISSVKLYHWSTEDSSALSVATTATGLSFKFQFPEWFRSAWRTITALSASIPSPVSPQVSLECLIQRQRVGQPTYPSREQLLAPALWWLMYPISVTFWVAVCCLLIAKVGHPCALWMARRAKRKLQTRLTSFGVSAASIKSVTSNATRMTSIMKNSSAMVSNQALVESLGGDVYAEAAASSLVTKAGRECLDMMQMMVDSEQIPNDRVASKVKEVLAGGEASLEPFLQAFFKHVERDRIEDVFSTPLSVIPVLCAFLQEDGAQAFLQGEKRSTTLRTAGTTDIASEAALNFTTNGDEFEEGIVPDVDVSKEYPVFGLFRNTAAKDVLLDSFPLYAVTMYSIWDTVTQRMLGLVQVKTILVTLIREGSGEQYQTQVRRWLYDMRFTFLKGDHLFIGVIGIIGLAIWSIGFLVVLFSILRRGRHHLQERHFIRNYGYFYNGLEPNEYWWEIIVKKLDILLLYVVTFTEIFHDPRAKLIMYLGLAGVFWAAHNMYHPYDNRQNRLADRLEDQGLGTRFTTILVVQMLLILNAHQQVNAVMALILVVINTGYLLTVAFVLGIEIPDVTTNEDQSKDMSQKAMEQIGGGGSNPLMAAFTRMIKAVVAQIIAPIIKLGLKILGILARMKHTSAKKVPHVLWQGAAHDFVVTTHEEERLPWYVRLFSGFFSRLYQLSDEQQKKFVAQSIGRFWDYVLINSDCHQLPACLMDIFFLLPGAIKKERAVDSPDPSVPFHLCVASRIRKTLTEDGQRTNDKKQLKSMASRRSAWAQGSIYEQNTRNVSTNLTKDLARDTTNLSRRTSFHHSVGAPENANSGEDFNTALLFIQRLTKTEMHAFVMEAEPDWAPSSRVMCSWWSQRGTGKQDSI